MGKTAFALRLAEALRGSALVALASDELLGVAKATGYASAAAEKVPWSLIAVSACRCRSSIA